MRLVLDQGVPRDATSLLRELGLDCTHVGEVGMSRATNQEILAWAVGQNATVVTLDADFHTILAVSGATAPSVVRLRRQGLNAAALVEIVRNVAAAFQAELERGSMVTVKANKITSHKLPIGGAD